MNSSFSFENNQVGRRQIKKEESKKMKTSVDGLEQEESQKNKQDEGKDEPQLSENTGKSLKTEMKYDDKTNVKHLKDLKQKQGTSRKDEDCKNPCDNRFGIKNVHNRDTKGYAPKTNSELSNGNDVNGSDMNNEEELKDCCKRKRKRFEFDCTSYGEKFHGSGLTCIGILPGLGGTIESSDDSDQSCSSGSEGNENVKYDLLGRSIVYESKSSTETR